MGIDGTDGVSEFSVDGMTTPVAHPKTTTGPASRPGSAFLGALVSLSAVPSVSCQVACVNRDYRGHCHNRSVG